MWPDIYEGLDVGFWIEYESFSFDAIVIDHILESSMFEFLESKTFVLLTANLD